ncbi:MAG: DUF2863 family protein [Burkholderiales bacterium]
MARSHIRRRPKSSREAGDLSRLAAGLSGSSSSAEDQYWEAQLAKAIDRLLAAGDDDALEAALDRLYEANPRGYDELADMIEARAESHERAGSTVLLIALPVLAWSRFSIPNEAIPPEVLENLSAHLRDQVLSAESKTALSDLLLSPDQLPRGYSATFEFTSEIAAAIEAGRPVHLDPKRQAKTAKYLADARYILAGVSAPRSMPLFRWQEGGASREEARSAWRTLAGECVAPIFAGCAYELMLPDAYFAVCRQSEREGRAFSLNASVTLLETGANTNPRELTAVIAPFGENQLDEYRVAFIAKNALVYGVVWPLLGAENEDSDGLRKIEALLRERGVGRTIALEELFPLEYCDDCGAPLFANAEGEPVHAEWPEDAETHLH